MGALNENIKKAKDIKSKKDKLTGILNDLDVFFDVASNMVRPNVNSDAVLMKHGYDALIRIAELAPTVYLSQYLSYYKNSVGQLAGLFVARAKADFAKKFISKLTKQANELDKFVKELEATHRFAYWMVDGNNMLSKNLPPKFKAHYKLEELYDEEFDSLANSSAKNKEQVMFAHMKSTTAIRIKSSRYALGLVIAARAKDLAGAYLVFMKEYQTFVNQVIKVDKYMRELNRSKGSGDRIFGYKTQLDAQYDLISGGSNNSDTVLRFMKGALVHSDPVKKVGKARRRLVKLSTTWKVWAHNVKTNSHMDLY
jgi:hypothetical protein